jgi:hypothetical protein
MCFKHHSMNTYWGSAGIAPRVLNLGTTWRWLASRPGRFTPDTHWIGGWVGTRADLDAVAKKINRTIAPVGNWSPVFQSVA